MSLAARSMPSDCAASESRIAYVGVEQRTVARSSSMVRSRCSVVIAPPGMTSAPNRSAPENADQKPIKGPKEEAKKTRSRGSTPAEREMWSTQIRIHQAQDSEVSSERSGDVPLVPYVSCRGLHRRTR